VDAGLVPRADGALLGQLTLIRPGEQADPPLAAAWAEQQLRQGLRQQAWALPLAEQPGELLQASVAFRPGGLPLVGAWPEAAGLWLFTGFSAGFSQSVVLAPLLADALCNGAGGQAGHRLQQLGVWPSWRTMH
jgi:glycine/D-amino acid oxidase-like deaminating enzyme